MCNLHIPSREGSGRSMTNLRLKSDGIRQTLDDLFRAMALDRKLKPFASETRLDDLALTQDLATKEIWFNDRNAFFDHAVTRSFRPTVIAIAKISE